MQFRSRIIMETPKWNAKLLRNRDVYEPAEDTFLMLDALEADSDYITHLKPAAVLEIGPGSGVVITAISSLLKSKAFYYAVDINPDACIVTKDTAELNNARVEVINADLLKSFRLREAFDMILFNPPYVQTTDDEIATAGISQSWAGGQSGRRIIDELLSSIRDAVSLNGVVYLLAISYNDIHELQQRMQVLGFDGQILKHRQIPGESLYVLKFIKIR